MKRAPGRATYTAMLNERGGFESDLPFTLEGRMSRRSARGALGDGGAQIELKTVNGSIRIH